MNLGERFLREVKVTEALFTYRFQSMMEDIHSHTYSLMLDNIVKDVEKRNMLFNAIKTIPAIKQMADWAFKWIDSPKRFAFRVVASVIYEGIFFSGMFASIFWLKYCKNGNKETSNKQFMEGLVTSNTSIARDEGQHCKNNCDIYRHIVNKLTNAEMYEIMTEALNIAKNFMTEALPVRLIGMNHDMMNDYLEYITDRNLVTLGYNKLFNKQNPFPFMNTIGIHGKKNFFEGRNLDYVDSNIGNTSSELTIREDDF